MYFYIYIVLILEGNSEIGEHVRNNLRYLICLSHLIRPRAVTNQRNVFSPKIPIFLHTCTPISELPSNISTVVVGEVLLMVMVCCIRTEYFTNNNSNYNRCLFLLFIGTYLQCTCTLSICMSICPFDIIPLNNVY